MEKKTVHEIVAPDGETALCFITADQNTVAIVVAPIGKTSAVRPKPAKPDTREREMYGD